MGLLDRFTAARTAILDYVSRPLSRIPEGAIIYDPYAAHRWTCTYTQAVIKDIQARCEYRSVIQLCDAMLTDDRIRSVLYTRAQGLVGAGLDFEEGKGRQKRRALKAAEAEADYWEMISEDEYIQMHVWGLLANFGPGRLRWWEKNKAGRYVPRVRAGRIVPQLEFWSPSGLRYEATRKQWIGKVETPDSFMAVDREIDFTSGEHILLSPFGGAGDVRRGLWIALCLLWLLKQHAIRDWANLGGQLGYPVKVAEFSLGQQGARVTDEAGADLKRKQLVDEIFAMGRKGIIALPPGFTMRLLAVPATNAQMFKDQIDAVNTAIAITVLGQNLAGGEIKGGSLAAAQIANTVRADIREFDAGGESRFLRTEVLSWWALLNFGDSEAAPWPVRDTEPPEDLTAAATTLNVLSQAVERFERMGWIFSRKDTEDRFKLPLTEGQVDTVPVKPTNTSTSAGTGGQEQGNA